MYGSNPTLFTILMQIQTKYKIVRVWGFGNVNEIPVNPDPTHSVWFQVLNSTGSYINYGENGLQRLDYVVSSAERYGVKLVLPFLNNWDDFGGINTYSTAFGSNATTFYTTPAAQAAYKSYVKAIVTRYKKSPAIFAWELGNEPRCRACDTSIITNWATEISKYIKSLDKYHLVTLGDEGWFAPANNIGDGSYGYSGYEGVDWVANLRIPTLDYGVFHLYPDSWGYNDTWGTTWIAEHAAAGYPSGKPVILEEYGTPNPHDHIPTEGPWQAAVLNSTIAADQIWQFAPYGLSIPVENVIDVNSIFYNDTEYKVLARDHAVKMLAKQW